jgi:GNAT superfamily N-acetyltransferase
MEMFEYIYNYKDIAELRLSFNQLAKSTFGIDFEDYYQSGFWNDQYICHSYVEDGIIIANVSTSFLDLVLKGEKVSAIQIGTVMTHQDYRGKGLAANLMKFILEKYESEKEIIFLFANKTVHEFYPKFGFKPIKQNLFIKNIRTMTPSFNRARKMDISKKDDLGLILRISAERKPISRVFGVENDQFLLLFYCMDVFSNNLFYLDDLDTIVIFKAEGKDLHIYDVISKADVSFASIIARITSDNVNKVIFHFTPDFKDLDAETIPYDDSNDKFFVKTEMIKIPENLMYPVIAHA